MDVTVNSARDKSFMALKGLIYRLETIAPFGRYMRDVMCCVSALPGQSHVNKHHLSTCSIRGLEMASGSSYLPLSSSDSSDGSDSSFLPVSYSCWNDCRYPRRVLSTDNARDRLIEIKSTS
jgi:hypothetical protein